MCPMPHSKGAARCSATELWRKLSEIQRKMQGAADEMPERERRRKRGKKRGKTLDRSAFAAEIYGKHFMNLCQGICAKVRGEFALQLATRAMKEYFW